MRVEGGGGGLAVTLYEELVPQSACTLYVTWESSLVYMCLFDKHITNYRFVCMDVTRENPRQHSGTEFDEIFECYVLLLLLLLPSLPPPPPLSSSSEEWKQIHNNQTTHVTLITL